MVGATSRDGHHEPNGKHSDSPPPSSSSFARSGTSTNSISHRKPSAPDTDRPEDNAHLDRSTPKTMARSSNTYERVEGGGMGSPVRGGAKKFAWKKFAVAAAVIVGLVWFVGPRERRSFGWSASEEQSTEQDQTYTKPYGGGINTHPYNPQPTTTPAVTKTPAVNNKVPEPTPQTFETDPDPSRTIHCTTPHTPDAALVQYALMIDAGSTGSRIHVYKFNNCGPSPAYEYEVFKMIQPGLSAFAGRPEAAAQSLDVLLNEAMRVVPVSLRACTPVAVKATAGLRLLPGSQSVDILTAVETRLREMYPFQLQDEGGVVVMDGKDEGVYAWITANYLLGSISADTPKDTPTYAVLDLGGASTQIVFKPDVPADGRVVLEEGEHRYELDFGGEKHVLYQHSYLGYGLMRARRHVHQLVDFMASIRATTGAAPDGVDAEGRSVIGNPCLARGTRRVVEITDGRSVTMDGAEIGGFEACDRVVQLVMAKDAICETKPCSFNGVYQPSLLDTFPYGKVLLLSYFYDRLQPLLAHAPASSPLTVATIAATARDVCQGRPVWLQRWGADAALMEELGERAEWCLDLTFMHGLLRMGYEFGDERDVELGKKIRGTELGWCLGATIAMVGGELKCRD